MTEYILELCQRASIICFILITALFLGIAIGEIIKECKALKSFKKERKMLFKRKKKEKPELAQMSLELVDAPIVVKRSLIKPTVCKFCRCTYQARHKDLVSKCEGYSFISKPSAECPVCETFNSVEFEEDENETSL